MTAGYRAGLVRAYWGEVFGVSMYANVATARTEPTEREMWSELAELERAMGSRMRRLVAPLADVDDRVEARRWAAAGLEEARRLRDLPWRDLMDGFGRGLDDDIARYAALAAAAPDEDRPTLDLLVEHERVAQRVALAAAAEELADARAAVTTLTARLRAQ